MSDNTNVDQTRLFIDGDGFRGAHGLALPNDPWEPKPTALEPFGAIRAGFTRRATQENRSLTAWNIPETYRSSRGKPETIFTLEPVDIMSKATVMTILRGGGISPVGEATDVFEWLDADSERFSLGLRAVDPDYGSMILWAPECELNEDPEDNINGDDLAGWSLSIKAYSSPIIGGKAFRRYTDTNPLAVSGG